MADQDPSPGSEPWKGFFKQRLMQACPAPGVEGDLFWIFCEAPKFLGIRGTSRFWQLAWAGWKMLRDHMKLRPPRNLDELLALPTCGVEGVWTVEGNAFINSPALVADIAASSALTLYSFWNSAAQTWFTADELVEHGWEPQVAQQLDLHLKSSLLPTVAAALVPRKELRRGNWATDLFPQESGDIVYDLLIRVIRTNPEAGTVKGVEYVLTDEEEGCGALRQLSPSPSILDDLLELPTEGLFNVLVLSKADKGRWVDAASLSLEAVGKPAGHAKSWWPSGRPVRDSTLNFAAWCVKLGGKYVPLLEITSAGWYRVCKKAEPGCVVEEISERWAISDQQARAVISSLWQGRLAPKLKTFLWHVAHQALPTIERKFDWLYDMGALLCSRCVDSHIVSTPHVLHECFEASCVWEALQQHLWRAINLQVVLSSKFLLLNLPTLPEERKLGKLPWWPALRAWC